MFLFCFNHESEAENDCCSVTVSTLRIAYNGHKKDCDYYI